MPEYKDAGLLNKSDMIKWKSFWNAMPGCAVRIEKERNLYRCYLKLSKGNKHD